VKAVALALGLSRSKIYQLIDRGELEAYRPGGRIRVAANAVVEFLEKTKL
jgi:excisionase family DNA binding protein